MRSSVACVQKLIGGSTPKRVGVQKENAPTDERACGDLAVAHETIDPYA